MNFPPMNTKQAVKTKSFYGKRKLRFKKIKKNKSLNYLTQNMSQQENTEQERKTSINNK